MKAMAGFGVPASRPTVLELADGRTRCSWVLSAGLDPAELTAYHDAEWGTPTRDPAALFEALSLTYFENGLSWAAVFRKRDAFRRAFLGFEPAAVAAMTPGDVDRLLRDASIVRNRRKIEATVHNAGLIAASLTGPGPSFVDVVWAAVPRVQPVLRHWSDGRMERPESVELSAELKRRGYRHVGPVVAHSFMQNVGVENGHFIGCFRAAAEPTPAAARLGPHE